MAKSHILKENWEGLGGPWKKVAPWMNLVARMLNNMTGHGKVDVQVTPSGIDVIGYGGSGGVDLSRFIGGINRTRSGVISMNAGLIKHQGSLYAIDATDVLIPGATSIVTARYERGVGAEYMSPSPSTRLQDDGTHTYIPLFTYQNGILVSIHRLGEIWL